MKKYKIISGGMSPSINGYQPVEDIKEFESNHHEIISPMKIIFFDGDNNEYIIGWSHKIYENDIKISFQDLYKTAINYIEKD
jgi:hypothetical protein